MGKVIAAIGATLATVYSGSRELGAGVHETRSQEAQAGYPRVVGHYPHVRGYVAGALGDGTGNPSVHDRLAELEEAVHGEEEVVVGYTPDGEPVVGRRGHHHKKRHHPGHHTSGLPEHLHPQQVPWRKMIAPGSPPVGEGHVPIPLNPETFGGVWGAGATPAGAPPGTTITFSARPQKPYKTSRLLIRGTKSGVTAIGNMVGQTFIGTDLQQGEVGNIDLESLGAANAFDTWVSFKQAEPGVWIRVLATLTAFPVGTDFEAYSVTAVGHYLH
jgi:hypothetical protein